MFLSQALTWATCTLRVWLVLHADILYSRRMHCISSVSIFAIMCLQPEHHVTKALESSPSQTYPTHPDLRLYLDIVGYYFGIRIDRLCDDTCWKRDVDLPLQCREWINYTRQRKYLELGFTVYHIGTWVDALHHG